MLAVDVEADLSKAKDSAAEYGVQYSVLVDTDQNVSRSYQLNQMPLSVVLDREGNVRYLHRGFTSEDSQLLAAEVSELLEE